MIYVENDKPKEGKVPMLIRYKKSLSFKTKDFSITLYFIRNLSVIGMV